MRGPAGSARVGEPTASVAWRAGLIARTPTGSVPKRGAKSGTRSCPGTPWLLVLRAARDRKGRCWVKVRLPSRPNVAAGWVDADRVVLRPTRWRRRRVARGPRDLGLPRRRPGSPLPRGHRRASDAHAHGLFSIVGVWRWNPAGFLGSYILPITAHSRVLQEFGGGDGRVGIHGRGG